MPERLSAAPGHMIFSVGFSLHNTLLSQGQLENLMFLSTETKNSITKHLHRRDNSSHLSNLFFARSNSQLLFTVQGWWILQGHDSLGLTLGCVSKMWNTTQQHYYSSLTFFLLIKNFLKKWIVKNLNEKGRPLLESFLIIAAMIRTRVESTWATLPSNELCTHGVTLNSHVSPPGRLASSHSKKSER